MLKTWQKEENLKWLEKLSGALKENGYWVWKDTGHMYTFSEGQFTADTEEGNKALKNILPEDQKLIK